MVTAPMATAAMAMAAPAFIHPRSLTAASARATEVSQAGAKAGRGSFRKRRCDGVLPSVLIGAPPLGDRFREEAACGRGGRLTRSLEGQWVAGFRLGPVARAFVRSARRAARAEPTNRSCRAARGDFWTGSAVVPVAAQGGYAP